MLPILTQVARGELAVTIVVDQAQQTVAQEDLRVRVQGSG